MNTVKQVAIHLSILQDGVVEEGKYNQLGLELKAQEIITLVQHLTAQDDIEYCGYCGDRMFWDDEHDDLQVCSQCLVKVPDEELEEMGLL